jgi:hypothetical protein
VRPGIIDASTQYWAAAGEEHWFSVDVWLDSGGKHCDLGCLAMLHDLVFFYVWGK